jgi:hypothetical protein
VFHTSDKYDASRRLLAHRCLHPYDKLVERSHSSMELHARVHRVASLSNRDNCVVRQLFLCCHRFNACGSETQCRPTGVCVVLHTAASHTIRMPLYKGRFHDTTLPPIGCPCNTIVFMFSFFLLHLFSSYFQKQLFLPFQSPIMCLFFRTSG